MSADLRLVHVVAAALIDGEGRVLIAQRPPGSHLAGGWEFPGGKLEVGETPLAGLARELHEEIGIEMGAGPHRPLGRVRHAYADREILIQTWIVTEFSGEPHGREGQALRWCDKQDLANANLLPADAPIVDALKLPARLQVTETLDYSVGERCSTKLWGVRVASASAASKAEEEGADFVMVTAPLDDDDTRELCARLHVPLFVVGRSLKSAWTLGATGINELPRT